MWNMWNTWGAQSEKPYHAPEPKKVHVSGLGPQTTEQEIKDIFSQHGTIEKLDFKKDMATGQTKKFCFITFESKEMAKNCLNNQAANVLNGTVLSCKSCGPNGDVDGGKPEDERIVFVGGLPRPAAGESDISVEDLNTYFSQFGEVLKVDLKTTSEGRLKGYCFVHFKEAEVAKQCIDFSESNGHTLCGSKIEVKSAIKGIGKFSHEKGDKGGKSGKGKGKGKGGFNDYSGMMNWGAMGGMGMGMMDPSMMMAMNGWGMGNGWGNGGGKGKGKGRSNPY